MPEENWDTIKDKFNYKEVLEDKASGSILNEIKERMRKTRFMMGFMMHSETDTKEEFKPKEDGDLLNQTKNIMSGITKTTADMLTMGINILVPLDLFWDKVFCIMGTSKNYVEYA